jgi:hypothetical protein
MTMAFHQFPPENFAAILGEMKRVAQQIIIVDYAVPLPQNITGWGSRVAEFFAGREHHRNFRKFYRLGGLKKFSQIITSLFSGSDFLPMVLFNWWFVRNQQI